MKAGDLIGGKYRLVHALGEGAMGSVWEALNERASRRVAIKLILKPSEDLRRRLLREARACGSLSHRNIVELYDVGETESGDPFLVMQLLRGETLGELLTHHRRLAPQTAAHIARDIALALAVAHEARIVHRDLKPANVFLHRSTGDEEGFVVKVLDFGVSRLLDAKDTVRTMPGTMVGSPAYMSPEQCLMSQDLDPRTDIWSLGVCLYEMITGIRPFQGNLQELIDKILTTNAPPISGLVRHMDEGLSTIVARCLKRDRAMRIGSASELAAMLEKYANARPEAPIMIASPANEVTPNGTMILGPEAPAKVERAAEVQESPEPPAEGAPRQAPWRETPLSDILTATSAPVMVGAVSTDSGITTSAGAPMEGSAERRSQAPEGRRSQRGLWFMIAGFLGLGIVCAGSFVVVSRGASSPNTILLEKGLSALCRLAPFTAQERKTTPPTAATTPPAATPPQSPKPPPVARPVQAGKSIRTSRPPRPLPF